MTTNEITTGETEEALRDVRMRYATVRYHLRQAANELLVIGREYGLTYEPGVDTDDAYGMVWAAHDQAKFDRDMLLELVQVMGE
jgi:hypothetical protein